MMRNYKTKKGFTLIEMMVAVFVFSVVMTIAVGAIFSVVSANKTSQAIKSVMDNLSTAVDTISRNVRYGSVYNCEGYANGFVPKSCSGSGSTSFGYRDRFENYVVYKLDGPAGAGRILKCDGPSGKCSPLTAEEVHIKDLKFVVTGAEANEAEHPSLVITISGEVNAGRNKSEFHVETMINQRNLMCKSYMNHCEQI